MTVFKRMGRKSLPSKRRQGSARNHEPQGKGCDAEAGKPGWRRNRNRQTEGVCWKLHKAYRILKSETESKISPVSSTQRRAVKLVR
jgi:hypothetical protein